MTAETLKDAILLKGQADAHYRTGHLITQRTGDYLHPLARAHQRAATNLSVQAGNAFHDWYGRNGMYDGPKGPTPEDYRQGAAALARQLEFGVLFDEELRRPPRFIEYAVTEVPDDVVVSFEHRRAEHEGVSFDRTMDAA